ncbi:Phosphatidylinositol:ceramide inositolphosphotransferase 2 (Inositol-phosphorylceramide synthase 2) (AtIPCS2) (IPC synthase 2) (Protein ENHANCING RPW8-MEDIATED HR-LIKE CELL DEATH 1) (Sphingolipid synthase 2), partial [Durusdinium trenchii]
TTSMQWRMMEEWDLLRKQWRWVLLNAVVLGYVTSFVLLNLAFYRYPVEASKERLKDIGHEVVPPLPEHLMESSLVDLPLHLVMAIAALMVAAVLVDNSNTGLRNPKPHLVNIVLRGSSVYALGHMLRGACYLTTSLPGAADRCLADAHPERFKPTLAECFYLPGDVYHNCGDLMFSGHMLLMLVLTLVVHEYSEAALWISKKQANLLTLLCVVLCLVESVLILAARHHYTSDLVVAFYTTPLLWSSYSRHLHPADLKPDIVGIARQILERQPPLDREQQQRMNQSAAPHGLAADAPASKEEESSAGIKAWGSFCARCFSAKANPPDAGFFVRKVLNDPLFASDQIKTKRTKDGAMIATLRLFLRDLHWVDGQTVAVAGIGEVCTAPEFRRQGHSRELLTNALEEVARAGRSAVLHAGDPKAQALYKSLGFAPIRTEFELHEVEKLSFAPPLAGQTSREIALPAENPPLDVLKSLADVYDASVFKFPGTVCRVGPHRELYWKSWVWNAWTSPRRVNPRLIVLQGANIAAYLYVCAADFLQRTLVIGEFALDAKGSTPSHAGADVLAILLRSALRHYPEARDIRCPRPVLQRLGLSRESDATLETDLGVMFWRPPGSTVPCDVREHVMWLTDAF